MAVSAQEAEALKRAVMFVPCKSEDGLRIWVKTYLGIDMPNCTVDPDSTSNPMALLWEAYSKMMVGDPDFGSCLFYASRDGFKSLSASIIELLACLHLNRSSGHMAAVESQSKVVIRYLKKYALLPSVLPFVSQMSDRRIEFTKYVRQDGMVIAPGEWELLGAEDRALYTPKVTFIQVVIATMQGANSLHSELFVLDELDLADPGPVEESNMIPTQCANGDPPLTLLTSSRKFAFGLVQKEIDRAEDSGLHIRHWNLIDVTKACPPERHLPDEPKIPIYYNDDYKAIPEERYNELPSEQQVKYTRKEGYAGCLSKCKLFAVCQGRLATEQKSKSPLLKSHVHVQKLFGRVSLDVAKAQLMCRKPSSFGLIYPRFDALTHVVKAHVIAELITGEPHPPDLSKAQLVQILIQNGAAFFGGIDHGFSHNFASSVGAKWGNRGFIIDSLSVPELELADKIEAIRAQEKRLGGVRPTYYADPEDPAANKTLGRHFKIAKWEKGPGSVQEGIDIVRMKLAPPFGAEPDLYFLDDDEGVDFLCKQLQIHHWKIDAAGNPTNVPDEEGKDECDSVRYGVMNVFKKGKLSLAGGTAKPTLVVEKQYTEDNWMQAKIAELTQGANNATTVTVRKGNFIFDG